MDRDYSKITPLDAPWLKECSTRAVYDAIAKGGHQVFYVGGCVRNALLGAPVSDVDLATSATPPQVVELASAAGLKPVPTGIDHGTITVVSDGIGYEITTFRCDVETDGRHAVVAFSSDIKDDARRRDFTMNALYANRDGAVFDPLGGGVICGRDAYDLSKTRTSASLKITCARCAISDFTRGTEMMHRALMPMHWPQ